MRHQKKLIPFEDSFVKMSEKHTFMVDKKVEAYINSSDEQSNIKNLALRICYSSREVAEPQRSRILDTLPKTIFISHTSLDDKFIMNSDDGNRSPKEESIWWVVGEKFRDPFYHSLKTGGAGAYERIVGLSLLVSRRVLIVWSENASKSNYVRAELLIATATAKAIVVYVAPEAPIFPLANVPLIYDLQSLRLFLDSWQL